MSRYFLEVAYKGTKYSGFQVQPGTVTIQSEVKKAMDVLLRQDIQLTGSSRTDAGVHALQNFFHFDSDVPPYGREGISTAEQFVYKMNGILPEDIAVARLIPVADDAHCRFDAVSRYYKYYLYAKKDPFLKDRAFYFPYRLDVDALRAAAALFPGYEDYTAFSKRKSQVKTFHCKLVRSEWVREGDCLVYHVEGNRFLRGMVRALTATMLQVARGRLSLDDVRAMLGNEQGARAVFTAPACGLFLARVTFPDDIYHYRP